MAKHSQFTMSTRRRETISSYSSVLDVRNSQISSSELPFISYWLEVATCQGKNCIISRPIRSIPGVTDGTISLWGAWLHGEGIIVIPEQNHCSFWKTERITKGVYYIPKWIKLAVW